MTTLAANPTRTRRAKNQEPSGPIPDAHITEATGLFHLASDATRLKLLFLLGEGERHVTDMCAALGMGQPALSHHLALMRYSGLVLPRRQGKHNFYGLTERAQPLLRAARAMVAGE